MLSPCPLRLPSEALPPFTSRRRSSFYLGHRCIKEEQHLSAATRRCLPPPPAHHTYSLAVTQKQSKPAVRGRRSDDRWRMDRDRKTGREKREGKNIKVALSLFTVEEKQILTKPEMWGKMWQWVVSAQLKLAENRQFKTATGLYWWTNHILPLAQQSSQPTQASFMRTGCFPVLSPVCRTRRKTWRYYWNTVWGKTMEPLSEYSPLIMMCNDVKMDSLVDDYVMAWCFF